MDISKANTKILQEESTLGIYVWEMPDGRWIGDEDALAREVRTFGIYEGGPKFLSARRKITDEEYAEQEQRLKWGLVPDPLDIGNYKDEIKNLRAEGQ